MQAGLQDMRRFNWAYGHLQLYRFTARLHPRGRAYVRLAIPYDSQEFMHALDLARH